MFQQIVDNISPTTLLCTGAILFLITYLCSQSEDIPNLPKGPRGIPFLGHVFVLASKTASAQIMKHKATYGDIVHYRMLGLNLFAILDYKLMKEAFVTQSDKTSRRPLDLLPGMEFIPTEAGITLNSGESHKVMRKFIMNAFRDFGVGKQSLEGKISEESQAIADLMLSQSSSFESNELRLLCQRGVSNIIISICFGQRCFSCMMKKAQVDFRLGHDSAELQEIQGHISTMLSINPLAQPSSYVPVLRYVPFIGDKLSVFKEMEEQVYKFIKNKIEQHRETFDPSNIRDFTDLYLKEDAENSQNSTKLTASSVHRAILDLFVAGSDTTAASMSWLFFFLAKYPGIQERMHKEIERVIGDRPPTYRDHQDMPFVSAVLLETWRMGSIGPIGLPHTSTDELTVGGYFIPKDSIIFANIFAIHMDETYWGDPKVFRPERFLDSNGNIQKHEHFLPFSMGPRSCIGENLARMETFLFITNFVQKMKFSFLVGVDPETVPIEGVEGITRIPKSHQVSLSPRK